MGRSTVPLVCLLGVATLTGLAAGLQRVAASCGDGGGSLLDHVLCDPDRMVSPGDSQVFAHLLTKLGNKAGHKVIVFLAATFTTHVEEVKPATPTLASTNTTHDEAGGGGGSSGDGLTGMTDVNRLKKIVVATNNLTTTDTPVILLVGIKDQFQMETWWSDSLNDVLTSDAREEARRNASTLLQQRHFTSAVVQAACYLSWKARLRDARTLQDIVFTVLWIAIVVVFVSLLVVIVVVLVRGRHQALAKAKVRAAEGQERGKQTSLIRYPITSVADIQDLGVVSFTSTGQVLLGTTDIVAMPPHDCSSTDNLLQD